MKYKVLIGVVLALIFGWAIFHDMTAQPKLYDGKTLIDTPILNPDQWAPAPDITFIDADEHPFSLKQFRGKVVLLNFWAAWCPVCLKELPSIVRVVNAQEGKIVLIIVPEDTQEENIRDFINTFKEKYKEDINHPYIKVAWDKNKKISADTFNTVVFPETVVLSTDLRMARKIIGEYDWQGKEFFYFLNKLQEFDKI